MSKIQFPVTNFHIHHIIYYVYALFILLLNNFNNKQCLIENTKFNRHSSIKFQCVCKCYVNNTHIRKKWTFHRKSILIYNYFSVNAQNTFSKQGKMLCKESEIFRTRTCPDVKFYWQINFETILSSDIIGLLFFKFNYTFIYLYFNKWIYN